MCFISVYTLYISSKGEFQELNNIILTLAPTLPCSVMYFYFIFILFYFCIIYYLNFNLILMIVLSWRSLLVSNGKLFAKEVE